MNKLRVWPGVVAAGAMAVLLWVLPRFVVDAGFAPLIGGAICALAVVVWWLAFSRAPWSERLGVIAFVVACVALTRPLLHESVAGAGMGMLYYIYAVPAVLAALAAAVWVSSGRSAVVRRTTIAASIVVACGMWALLRTEGITGGGSSQFAWRWSKSPEERLLATVAKELPVALPPAPVVEAETPKVMPVARVEPAKEPAPVKHRDAAWPGFRGPRRDGIVRGVRISTDWSGGPPVQVWRRPVGPGWSSFAVDGGLFYTQEQRGEDELVSCYRVSDGKPVWIHRDRARFWESNGGAGPRGTPTLADGRVYTMGATGIVNALDARTGAVVWTRDAAKDTGATRPGWGFAGSPILSGDLVIVAASSSLAAYDAENGKLRWSRKTKGASYSSPQVLMLDGVPQVVMLTASGATGVAPADGSVLWEHAWPGSAILQPALAGDGDVLITTGDMSGGLGVRRVGLSHADGWSAAERWTSNGLKPYFNDLVVHKGYAFGFDGRILSCIDLKDGKRVWKGGRYGNGQLILLADQDVLLVVSETGELALVSATPDGYNEIAKVQAIEGKTWNHPALVRDTLLVRNGEEMAAFRLTAAK